ncbi:MAG: DNA primase [Marinovum sp.]|nr:DNA primase [Marinovum sp.]
MIEANIQQTILRNLLSNEDYLRKVIPFLKKEYFEGEHKIVFNEIVSFVNKYNKLPTKESITVDMTAAGTLEPVSGLVDIVFTPEPVNEEWLLNSTEKWCQDRAIYLAIMESINVIDGKNQSLTKNAVPEILSDALAVSFDTNVGHDYIDNSDDRFDFYHRVEDRLPFDLENFNDITKGGIPNKTLNIALAGTGVGKSLFMCHVAASSLMQGKNVLYITLEMAEERIAERIDANLFNLPIDQLESLSKKMFDDKIAKIAKRNIGKLIVKEYPTGAAHASHFRALLNELKLKKQFEPNIIFIDYLNICSSSRMKGLGGAINSYSYVKAIAEELRGLAVEFNVPVFSATQTTRSGFSNTDVGLEDTSESFGLPATADFMFALISTEDLQRLGQMMVKQLKNRYNDPTYKKRFVVGVDRSRMRLYDVEESAQTLTDDTPVFDNTPTGERQQNFSDFKM